VVDGAGGQSEEAEGKSSGGTKHLRIMASRAPPSMPLHLASAIHLSMYLVNPPHDPKSRDQGQKCQLVSVKTRTKAR
jgi:hypothetical protein